VAATSRCVYIHQRAKASLSVIYKNQTLLHCPFLQILTLYAHCTNSPNCLRLKLLHFHVQIPLYKLQARHESLCKREKEEKGGVYNAPSNANTSHAHSIDSNLYLQRNAKSPLLRATKKRQKTVRAVPHVPHMTTHPIRSRILGLFSFSCALPPSVLVKALLCARGGAESGPGSLLITESPNVLMRGSIARRAPERAAGAYCVRGTLVRLGDAPAGRGRRGTSVPGAEPRRPVAGSTIGGGRISTELSILRRGRMLGRWPVW
jgi:hypothetical protein